MSNEVQNTVTTNVFGGNKKLALKNLRGGGGELSLDKTRLETKSWLMNNNKNNVRGHRKIHGSQKTVTEKVTREQYTVKENVNGRTKLPSLNSQMGTKKFIRENMRKQIVTGTVVVGTKHWYWYIDGME